MAKDGAEQQPEFFTWRKATTTSSPDHGDRSTVTSVHWEAGVHET